MNQSQIETMDTLKRVAIDRGLSTLEMQAIVAEELGFDADLFDIARFSEEMCKRVVVTCTLVYMNLIPKDPP